MEHLYKAQNIREGIRAALILRTDALAWIS